MPYRVLLFILLACVGQGAIAQCGPNCVRIPADAATLQAGIDLVQGLPGATVELTQGVNESVTVTGSVLIRSANGTLKRVQSSAAAPLLTVNGSSAVVELDRIELIQVNGVVRNEVVRIVAADRWTFRNGMITANDGTPRLIEASGSQSTIEITDSQLAQTGPASISFPTAIRNAQGQTIVRRSTITLRPNASGGIGIEGGAGRIDFLDASLLNLNPIGPIPTQVNSVNGLSAYHVRVADSTISAAASFPGRAVVAREQLEVYGSRLGASFNMTHTDFRWLTLALLPGSSAASVELRDNLIFLGGIGLLLDAPNPHDSSSLQLRVSGNSFIEQHRHALWLDDANPTSSPAVLDLDLRNNLFYGCQRQYIGSCSTTRALIQQGWSGQPEQVTAGRNIYLVDVGAPVIMPATAFSDGRFPEPMSFEVISAMPGWPQWIAPNNANDLTPGLTSPLLNSGVDDPATRPDGPRVDPLGRRRPAGRWDVGAHENPDPLLTDGFETP